MFAAAASAVSSLVTVRQPGASLLPHIDDLRSVSVTVAVAVAETGGCGGLGRSQVRRHRSTGAGRDVAAGVSPDPGVLRNSERMTRPPWWSRPHCTREPANPAAASDRHCRLRPPAGNRRSVSPAVSDSGERRSRGVARHGARPARPVCLRSARAGFSTSTKTASGNLIRLFRHEDIPVTVGLVVDHSGSMRPKLADVTAAARTFVQSSNPEDEMFVVNFNENVTLGLPGTTPVHQSLR